MRFRRAACQNKHLQPILILSHYSSTFTEAIAINIDNGFDLVAVWEKDSKRWHLLQLARLLGAISLYQENPKARLVFPMGPMGVNPNHLEQKMLRSSSKEKDRNFSVGAKK